MQIAHKEKMFKFISNQRIVNYNSIRYCSLTRLAKMRKTDSIISGEDAQDYAVSYAGE